MKILRSEHRWRIDEDLDYAIGLLRNIRTVAFKAYNTSDFTLDIDMAIKYVTYAKSDLRRTKFKKEKK